MSTGHKNNKSTFKGIRFPHELIDAIEKIVSDEKKLNPQTNFSSWVIQACEEKLEAKQRGK
ncbi:YlcI/YnfO family protein [Pantoea sp. SGAir0175]